MVNSELGLKKLESILYNNLYQKERDEAAKEILKFYPKNGGYLNTRKIIKDQKISGLRKEGSKKEKGYQLIKRVGKIHQRYCLDGGYHLLIKMFEIGNISEELRDEAGERVIKYYIRDKNYLELMLISQNRKLSTGLRNKAENGCRYILRKEKNRSKSICY